MIIIRAPACLVTASPEAFDPEKNPSPLLEEEGRVSHVRGVKEGIKPSIYLPCGARGVGQSLESSSPLKVGGLVLWVKQEA